MSSQFPSIENRYQVIDLIGTGGMGSVYRVNDRLMDTTVALKKVAIPNEQIITNTVSDPTKQSHIALATEFRTLASLRHPHIISVLDYGFDSEQFPYFTMEYIENAQIITDIAVTVSMDVKWQLIIQMLQALSYLHRRGILHRDLKPDNVLVTATPENVYQVKVLDFGLAVAHNYVEPSDSLVGTLAYVAPEILESSSASRVSDLYALGMMIYEMLAGEYPFEMQNIPDLMQSILYTRPRMTVPGIERSVGSILKRLLHKDPLKRYASAEETMQAIKDVVEVDLPIESVEIRESFLQSAQFVGREQELDKLQDALLSAKQDKGSLWLVEGEGGVGKSRLLDELRATALVEGVMVLTGQAVSDGGLSYEVWRNIVRRLILLSDVTDEQAGVLRAIIPDLERILGRTVNSATQLSETAQNGRLIDVIAQLITASHQPLLIILEDLHWATDSLDPIIQIVDKIPDLNICIVGSYRTDEQVTLRDKLPTAQIMTLNRLTHDEIVELSVSMIGTAANQSGVIDLVERETEGNTFFIVEVMRTLAEDAGQLNNIGRVTLPASVVTGGMNKVIERRFNQIPHIYHPLLNTAAVIGRRLDLNVLQEVLRNIVGEFTLDDWLSVCESANVITVHDGQWQFGHDKLREYLLQKVDDSRDIHQLVAEAIEIVYPDDDTRYRTLAQHWLAAHDIAKAIYYGVPAAKLMQDISHYGDAIDLLYRIYRRWNQDEVDPVIQCDFFLRLGELHERIAEYEIAKDYFERSHKLALELDDPIRLTAVLFGKGLVAYDQGEFDFAQTNLQSALEIGKDVATPEIIAQVYKILSNIYSQQDNFEASNRYLQLSLAISREHDIKIEIAGGLNNLGVNAFVLGDHDTARQYYQQALDVYTEVGYRTGIALSLGNLGDVAYDEGLEAQLDYYQKALAINRDIGNQWGIALCLENLGTTYFMFEFYALAMQAFQESLQITHKIGDRYGTQHLLMQLGFVYCLQADYEQAKTSLDESLNLADELDLGLSYVLCLGYYAYYDICMEELDSATIRLNDALQRLANTDLSSAIYDILSIYACLFKHKGRYNLSLLMSLFLIAEPTLDESMKKFILNPLRDELQAMFTAEDLEQLSVQVKTLTVDDIIQQMPNHQTHSTESDLDDATTGC